MKSFLLITFCISSFSLNQALCVELSGGGGDYGNDVSSENIPSDSDFVVPGYDEKCSPSEKAKRIRKHDYCRRNSRSLGLSQVLDDADIVPKFSCPEVEKPLQELLSGCLIFAGSLAAAPVIALGQALGVSRYALEIKKVCGSMPIRRMSLPIAADMPDGQQRFESLTSDQRYQGEVNSGAIQNFSNCKERLIAKLEQEEAEKKERETAINTSEGAAYRSSMQRIENHCKSNNLQMASMLNSRRIARHGGVSGDRRNTAAVNNCLLNSMKELGIECSRCLTELSPEIGKEENGRYLANIDKMIRKKVKGFSCYSYEKRGELTCALASSVVGGAGAAIAGVKLAKAFGPALANQLKLGMGRVVSESDEMVSAGEALSLSGAQASRNSTDEILNAVDTQRAEARRRAAMGVGDSLETRQAYAEAVLNVEEGSLDPSKAQAVWDAHRVSDGNNERKAMILRRAGFSDAETRALMDERYKVAGGYQGVASNAAPSSSSLPTRASIRSKAEKNNPYNFANRAALDMQKEVINRNDLINNALRGESDGPSFLDIMRHSDEYSQMLLESPTKAGASLQSLKSVSSASTTGREVARIHLTAAAQSLRGNVSPVERSQILKELDERFEKSGFSSNFLSSEENLSLATKAVNINNSRPLQYVDALERYTLVARRRNELSAQIAELQNNPYFRQGRPDRVPGLSEATQALEQLKDDQAQLDSLIKSLESSLN